jgi:hypothetical protein
VTDKVTHFEKASGFLHIFLLSLETRTHERERSYHMKCHMKMKNSRKTLHSSSQFSVLNIFKSEASLSFLFQKNLMMEVKILEKTRVFFSGYETPLVGFFEVCLIIGETYGKSFRVTRTSIRYITETSTFASDLCRFNQNS